MSDHVAVGRVGKPHGLDGAFVVERGSEDVGRYAVGATLHVDGVPAKVVISRQVGRGRRAIKLDRAVERGQQLTVPRADLPPPEPGTFYVFQLIGLPVVDERGVEVATVKDVIPGVANDNLELSTGVLVPLIEDAIVEIDVEAGSVRVNSSFID